MTNLDLIDALDEASQSQCEWQAARNPSLTQQRLEDYASGFGDGWRQAVRYLKEHGALKLQ